MIEMRCSFAMPGTYGHECGAVAVKVAVKPSKLTKSGEFFAGRCAECATFKGGENTGVIRWEALDPENQINDWK